MNFHSLLKRLGEPRPQVWRRAGASHFHCALPNQPLERIKGVQGCRIRVTHERMAAFDIPVESGIARIIGEVHVASDGTQTLTGVTAFEVPDFAAAASAQSA